MEKGIHFKIKNFKNPVHVLEKEAVHGKRKIVLFKN